jgi:hypothetical protein
MENYQALQPKQSPEWRIKYHKSENTILAKKIIRVQLFNSRNSTYSYSCNITFKCLSN